MSDPPTPAERFAMLIRHLIVAVDSRGFAGLLARSLVMQIINRLIAIGARFARIAARIAAGRPTPGHRGPRRPSEHKPRRPDPLPKQPGWLLPLAPPDAAAFGSQLQILLADPAMVALIAAAPAEMRRPLRSLCRMLGTTPPPILALPPVPRRKPPAPERPPRRPPERPKRPARVRYVFGLRYPPPFRDPA